MEVLEKIFSLGLSLAVELKIQNTMGYEAIKFWGPENKSLIWLAFIVLQISQVKLKF